MRVFRLQKYDPSFYDGCGRYTRSEWTHVSDIGRVFSDGILTAESYLQTENRFIAALDALIDLSGVTALRAYGDNRGPRDVEALDPILWGISREDALTFRGGDWLSGVSLKTYCRLCLRDIQGDALTDERQFFLDFTGDYYVHVGTHLKGSAVADQAQKVGLFLIQLGELGDGRIDDDAYKRLLPALEA